MSFPNSAGVYDRISDQSFVVNGSGLLSGGIVITSKKGPAGLNIVYSAKEFIETYGKPTMDNPSMYCALRFLARGNVLSVYRITSDSVTASGVLDIGTGVTGGTLEIEATSPGSWGNSVSVSVEEVANPSYDSVYLVVSVDGIATEKFEVSRDPDARNGFGSTLFIEDVVNKRSRYIRVTDDPAAEGNLTVGDTVTLTSGGDDATAPSSGDIIDAWDAFANPEKVPAKLLINAGWAVPAVQQKMLAIAEARRDCRAILDVPEDISSDVEAMVLYRKTLLAADTFYGGLYGGWIRIYDSSTDREVMIPPSGDVAGVFLHTVTVGEYWDAPAGLQRGIIPNALGVSLVLSEGQRDALYAAGINPVTTYAGANAVVWGQKTLQLRASAMDRFNVVNLVLWINERMVSSLQPFVFQPNTTFTRDSVNFMLSSFLGDIKKRGGLYDFTVDTSEEINTSTVIDNGQMLVDVYIKPVRTAEFIRVTTIITPTGVTLGA